MYIDHLNRFFEISQRDRRLSSSHFSLYIALFRAWNRSRFKSSFFINRQEIMEVSHLGSRSTYTKAISDLNTFGYIRIDKAGNRFGRSLVTIRKLNNSNTEALPSLFETPLQEKQPEVAEEEEQKMGSSIENFGLLVDQNRAACLSKIGQVSSPKLGHIKDKDYKEVFKREDKAPAPTPPLINENEIQKKDRLPPVQKCSVASASVQEVLFYKSSIDLGQQDYRTKEPSKCQLIPEPPTLKEVHEYFVTSTSRNIRGLPQLLPNQLQNEALKFYAHYNAIGWCLGGSNPIKNWKAACLKWICNCRHPPGKGNSPKTPNAPQLIIPSNNNYHEPL